MNKEIWVLIPVFLLALLSFSYSDVDTVYFYWFFDPENNVTVEDGEVIADVKSSVAGGAFCLPSFKKTAWSTCEDGTQERSVIDLNSCENLRTEVRKCEEGKSSIENLFLNARQIDLKREDFEDAVYSASLDDSLYNEIFYTNTEFESLIVVVDPVENDEYLGRLVEDEGDRFYYVLQRIDANVIGELKQEGFIPISIQEKLDNSVENVLRSGWFQTLFIVFTVIVVVVIIVGVTMHFRKKSDKYYAGDI